MSHTETTTSEDSIVNFECPFGTEHTVPGDDVRVLRHGESHFYIACDCSPVPLEFAHHPHELISRFCRQEHILQFVNVEEDSYLAFVDGTTPSPEQWLALEELAEGWYDDNPWRWLPEYNGTPETLREEMREQVREIADTNDKNSRGGASDEDRQARAVSCPACGAEEGTKCQRPSGHDVRQSHSDRIQLAIENDIIEKETNDPPSTEQVALEGWA
jgi:hypothetical protein